MNTIVAPETGIPSIRLRGADGRFLPNQSPPTLKQLYKWTDTFVTRFEEVTKNPSLTSLGTWREDAYELLSDSNIAALRRDMRLWDTARRRNIRRAFSQYQGRVAEAANALRHSLNYIARIASQPALSVPLPWRRVSPPKRIDVLNDLIALCKHMPAFWNKNTKSIKVLTEPVVLLDVNDKTRRYEFGRFFIELIPFMLISDGVNHGVRVTAHTPRFPVRTDGTRLGGTAYPHPHVNLGDLCFGTGLAAATKALKEGRIFDIVTIVDSVLHNYGGAHGQAPFVNLEYWRGVCDSRFNPETGEPIPIDAVLQSAPVPPRPIVECESCGAEVEDLYNCSGCGSPGCGGCRETCGFSGCTNRLCEGCYFVCDNCDAHICVDHYASDDRCVGCDGVEDEQEEDDLD
jgi:hypothetical protein